VLEGRFLLVMICSRVVGMESGLRSGVVADASYGGRDLLREDQQEEDLKREGERDGVLWSAHFVDLFCGETTEAGGGRGLVGGS
jgi:hypothetical protein